MLFANDFILSLLANPSTPWTIRGELLWLCDLGVEELVDLFLAGEKVRSGEICWRGVSSAKFLFQQKVIGGG